MASLYERALSEVTIKPKTEYVLIKDLLLPKRGGGAMKAFRKGSRIFVVKIDSFAGTSLLPAQQTARIHDQGPDAKVHKSDLRLIDVDKLKKSVK